MSGSTVGYMGWQGNLKQGSLDNTPLFRHCIDDILQNNVLCYKQKSNIECDTCKLYAFQSIDECWSIEHHYTYFSAHDNFVWI